MLEAEITPKPESPYSSNVTLLRKSSGEHRCSIQYRKLNAVSEFQAELLPDLNKLFTRLAQCHLSAKIDLSKRYYQIPAKKKMRI